VPLNCVNYSSFIKCNLLAIYFVALFQTIDFMWKTFYSLQYTIFYQYIFHQCLNISNFEINTPTKCWFRNLEKILQTVHQSPVAQNPSVTASHS